MKKLLRSVAAMTVVLCMARVPQANSHKEKETYREINSRLPPLHIVDTLGKVFTEKDFSGNGHFFLILFNPTCGHCIGMAKVMTDSSALFAQSKVAFMAGTQMAPYLRSYIQAGGLGHTPQFAIGVDSAEAIEKLYNYTALPQINVYDKNRKLVRIFYGEIPLDSLKTYLP
ncbi:MAG: hypothetical protein QM642_03770 [Edaphocola sp.]